jgi:hypothetical protein
MVAPAAAIAAAEATLAAFTTAEAALATTNTVATRARAGAGPRVGPLRGSSGQGGECEDDLCVHLED